MEQTCKYNISYTYDLFKMYNEIDYFVDQLKNGHTKSSVDSFYRNHSKGGTTNISTFKQFKRMIMKVAGFSKASTIITKCEYNHFEHGSHVFCRQCLKENRIVRRLEGCKCEQCYANNEYWRRHSQERNHDLSNILCNHERITSKKYFYCMFPISHIILLTNCRLDDKFINSTKSELIGLVETCREYKTISPAICRNSIYAFHSFGENDIAQRIASLYDAIPHTKSLRNSLKACVERLTASNSIEMRCYCNDSQEKSNSVCDREVRNGCEEVVQEKEADNESIEDTQEKEVSEHSRRNEDQNATAYNLRRNRPKTKEFNEYERLLKEKSSISNLSIEE